MKNILIVLAIIIIGTGAYFLFFQKQDVDEPYTPTQITEGPITDRGVITCIPKIGTGPQTMECALGLKNTEGVYYGLRYLSDHDENFALVSPDIEVEITGTLVADEMFGPDGNRYDTVGTIEIETISQM